MVKSFLTYLFITVFSVSAFAQNETVAIEEIEAIYEDIKSFYEKDNYSLSMSFESFKGHNGIVPQDAFVGFVRKQGSITETYSFSGYSIQNEELKVLIDSSERIIGITYPDTNAYGQFSEELFETKMIAVSSSELDYIGRIRVLTLNYKKGYTYEQMKLTIQPNGMLSKIEMLYANEISVNSPEGEEEKAKAKVVISYAIMAKKESKELNNITEFIQKVGNQYKMALPYQKEHFELIDFRYTN
jgi:hypothetical protein